MPNDSKAKPKRATFSKSPEVLQAKRRIRNQNRGNADPVDWHGVSAENVHRVISAVTAKQCAVRFGYTMDGGAYAIGILGDGDPYTEYVRPSEDIEQHLRGLAEDFENS